MAKKTVPGDKPTTTTESTTVAVPLDVIEQLRKAFAGITDGMVAIDYLCEAIRAESDEMVNFMIAIRAIATATDHHVGDGADCVAKLKAKALQEA